jgi:hypothetical protein
VRRRPADACDLPSRLARFAPQHLEIGCVAGVRRHELAGRVVDEREPFAQVGEACVPDLVHLVDRVAQFARGVCA